MEGLNLLALAAEVENDRRFADFAAKVRRAAAVGSGHQDLGAANEALPILNKHTDLLRSKDVKAQEPIGNANSEDGVICGALLAHAIILYARATETKPIDRLKWFGRGLLRKDLLPIHEEVMRYRDKALAHFGLDPMLEDGPAISNALVLKNPSKTDHITIAYVETRANTRSALAEKLQKLVNYLLPVAHERYDQRIMEVWEAFKASLIGRKELAEAMKKSAFSSETLAPGSEQFFDDDEARELSAHYTVRKQKSQKD